MAFDPRLHPRYAATGQFRKVDLKAGWYEITTRSGAVVKEYVGDQADHETGSNLLHMATVGRSDKAGGRPETRILVSSTKDGELMRFASSPTLAAGVVNYDKAGPIEDFSLTRIHDHLPVSQSLPADETALGGRASNDSNKKLMVLDPSSFETANHDAFEQAEETGTVISMRPADIAEAQVEIRHAYQRMGLTEGQARRAPVYVYRNQDGELTIEPAHHVDEETGTWYNAVPPYELATSPIARVSGADITRMSRAMQKERIDNVDIAISRGTGDYDNGAPINNVMHFRAEKDNERTGDRNGIWASVEGTRRAPQYKPSVQRGTNEYAKRVVAQEHARERIASRLQNPKDASEAARMLRKRYGSYRYADDITGIKLNKDPKKTRIFEQESAHVERVYNGDADLVSRRATDAIGFAEIYNAKMPTKMRVDDDKVQALSDGLYRARIARTDSDGTTSEHWEYFNAMGEHSRSKRNDSMYDEQGNRI